MERNTGLPKTVAELQEQARSMGISPEALLSQYSFMVSLNAAVPGIIHKKYKPHNPSDEERESHRRFVESTGDYIT